MKSGDNVYAIIITPSPEFQNYRHYSVYNFFSLFYKNHRLSEAEKSGDTKYAIRILLKVLYFWSTQQRFKAVYSCPSISSPNLKCSHFNNLSQPSFFRPFHSLPTLNLCPYSFNNFLLQSNRFYNLIYFITVGTYCTLQSF